MILSIESSCDDSSIAITRIEDNKLLFHRKISQDSEHSLHGGVVPELASRLHAIALPKILKECAPYFSSLKAIAITNAPGLNITLLEGVMMAKSLSLSLELPLIAINHLKGHLYSLFLEREAIMPLDALLVSGGHTMILEAKSFESIDIIGASMDDSFGESFDKVAKMLGLGYPGGPIVEQYAKEGDPKRFPLPTPLTKNRLIEFSFSGLKNAVRLAVESCNGAESIVDKRDICASFQHSAIEHIIKKCTIYLEQSSLTHFGVVGGASANEALRTKLQSLCARLDKTLLLAPLPYCSDNAAMIGRCAIEAYKKSYFTPLHELTTTPRTATIS